MVACGKLSKQAPMKIEVRPGGRDVRREPLDVRGVELYRFPWVRDPRGDLTVGEFGKGFPFPPKRYFIVFGVSPGTLRGDHAHKRCHQFLICAQGHCVALVDDGVTRREVLLDNPSIGLYVPPMIWGTQYDYSVDGALLVFASDHYDPEDYIRDYGEFQEVLRGNR
jgi:UDP-2-acetamido-3-amino-2,3-dideoxy-glucuronate N-acetyltransferase